MKSITEQLLDAKLLGEDKAEIQRLQQLLNEEEEAYINEIFDEESDSEFKIKEVTKPLNPIPTAAKTPAFASLLIALAVPTP